MPPRVHNAYMRMQVVLLPPQEVQDELATTVGEVSGGGEQLDLVPAEHLHLRLANFGNVSHADSVSVRKSLNRELQLWTPMKFYFGAAVALEPIGDDSVWAQLEGDVEQLAEVADVITKVGKRLGFPVDRRLSRRRVRVGRITAKVSEDYLQRLLDHLEQHRGPDWTCEDLALVRTLDAYAGPIPSFEVVHRTPLGQGRQG